MVYAGTVVKLQGWPENSVLSETYHFLEFRLFVPFDFFLEPQEPFPLHPFNPFRKLVKAVGGQITLLRPVMAVKE